MPFPTPADHSLHDIPTDSEIRKVYPIDFYPHPQIVRLPLGTTTYWLLGPESGPKVALVHGISTPSLIWKHLAPWLADHGFRVLVYDLFGRGYSEAPDVVYDANLYVTQLALLLQHIQWPNAHIVGLSMGGGITGAFAATFPNLVTEKIVLIASAGVMELPVPSAALNQPRPIVVLQKEFLPGYTRALTSSLQFGPIRDLENAFKAVADSARIKTLIVHGTNDNTVAFKFGERIKNLIPSAKFVPIEGGDHDLLLAEDYYETTRQAVLDFLQA